MEDTGTQGSEVSPPIEAPFPKRVYMTLEKFRDIVHKLHTQETRLQAYANLHIVLYEKDQELQEKQELVKQFQTQLTQAQCRIRNLVQNLGDAAPDTVSTQSKVKDHLADPNLPLLPGNDQDLQTDGASPDEGVIITVRHHNLDYPAEEASPEDQTVDAKINLKSVELIDQDVQPDSGLDSSRYNSRSLRPRGLKDVDNENIDSDVPKGTNVPSLVTITTTQPETSLGEPKEVPESRPQTSLPPIMPYITGVSRIVFENVVKENVKLKKMLQDVIQRSDIQEYLNVREYEDVVRLLRMELVNKQQKIQSLQEDILAKRGGKADTLAAKVVALDDKIDHLQKQLKTKQMLLDTYSNEIEKLRDEKQKWQQLSHQTKEILSTQESDSLPLTSELPSGIPVTVATQRIDSAVDAEPDSPVGELEKYQRKLGEITEKYERQINQLKQNLREKEDINSELLQKSKALGRQPPQQVQSPASEHQLNELTQQNLSLRKEVSSLGKEVEALKEKESVYKFQLEAFREDFDKEKQAHYQMYKLKTHYEHQLGQQQGQFNRLQGEYDKLNKSYEDLRKQKSHQTPSTMVTGGLCASGSSVPWLSKRSPMIVADGPPSILPKVQTTDPREHLPQKEDLRTGRSQADGAESCSHKSLEMLECPRCQKEFKDPKELERHTRRCIDS